MKLHPAIQAVRFTAHWTIKPALVFDECVLTTWCWAPRQIVASINSLTEGHILIQSKRFYLHDSSQVPFCDYCHAITVRTRELEFVLRQLRLQMWLNTTQVEHAFAYPKIIEIIGVASLLEHRLITNVASIFFFVPLSANFIPSILFVLEHLI